MPSRPLVRRSFRRLVRVAVLAVGAALVGGVNAETPPSPQGVAIPQNLPGPHGVVNLGASASVEVPQDLIGLTLAAHREAADAGTVQQQLKQALDAALAEARKAARPGQVDVRTGAFNVGLRYGDKGVPTGWQGNAELVLEGRDMAAIGQLAGRLRTMTVARVGYDLSRDARARNEGEATAQAIAQFQARAADAARLFGYAGYTLREVSVNAADASPPRPVAAMAMKRLDAVADDAPLPVEAGRATITVNVSGAVQLVR